MSWRQALPPTVFLGDADLSLAVEVASSVYADARTHFSSYAIGSLAAFALKNYEGGSCFRLRRVSDLLGFAEFSLSTPNNSVIQLNGEGPPSCRSSVGLREHFNTALSAASENRFRVESAGAE